MFPPWYPSKGGTSASSSSTSSSSARKKKVKQEREESEDDGKCVQRGCEMEEFVVALGEGFFGVRAGNALNSLLH